jgi:Bacterial Ig-like domain
MGFISLRQNRTIACLGMIVAVTMVAPPALASANARSGSFCRIGVVRDYEAPLRQMPPVRHTRASGRIPGGPDGLRLLPQARVQSSSGQVGFFADSKTPRGLWWRGWEAEALLWKITSSGKTSGRLPRRKRFPSEVAPTTQRQLGFRVSDKPAFYRIDLTFRQESTGKRRQISEYFRIVRRYIDIRLTADRAAYHTGETVMFRLENFGSVLMGYGYSFRTERLNASTWESVPELTGPTSAVLLGIDLGLHTKCQRLPLTEGVLPGRYRVTKQVFPWMRRRARTYVWTEFDVLPGANAAIVPLDITD